MAATTSLPPAPAAASSAALDAATSDIQSRDTGSQSPDAQSRDDMRTVFTDPENFNVKHPLYHKWTLWFDNPSARGMTKASNSKDSWGEDLNKVVDFDSVEEFWGLYNNILPPSTLPQKANYYLFKEGIKPAWEDPRNANGGKWSIRLPRDKSRAGIDKLWLFTVCSTSVMHALSLTLFHSSRCSPR